MWEVVGWYLLDKELEYIFFVVFFYFHTYTLLIKNINRALTHIFRLVAHTNQERNGSASPSWVKYPSDEARKAVQMSPHEATTSAFDAAT